jgi:hypothetical protein
MARGKTPAAIYTFVMVDFDFNNAGLILIGNIGHFHRAFPDASITAIAQINICFYYFLYFRHIGCITCILDF